LRLQEQVAGLTRRVFHLEQQLEQRTASSPPPARSGEHGRENPDSPPSTGTQVSIAGRASRMTRSMLPGRADASLEARIGGQWLNRVGIIAVLVGLSYFLKLAFENNWIGPGTRVAIGLLAGCGLMLWSERFRRRGFAGFSFSLKAIGISSLYLSLWS